MARTGTLTLALLLTLTLSRQVCATEDNGGAGKNNVPAALQGVGFDQRLNAQVPLDLTFTEETGHPTISANASTLSR